MSKMTYLWFLIVVANLQASAASECNVPESTSDSLGMSAYLDCQVKTCEDFDDAFFKLLTADTYDSCTVAIPDLKSQGMTCTSDVPPSLAPALPTGSQSKKLWQLCPHQCKSECEEFNEANSGKSVTGTCKGNITEFVIGFTGTVTNTNWADLYAMVMIDLDFRKGLEPELVQMYGEQIFPIENQNPCLRIRPIYLDNSGFDTPQTDAVSLWNFGHLAYGLNGLPRISGMVATDCKTCLTPLSAFAAQVKIPVGIYSEQTALADKEKYPYTFRMSPSAVLQADIMFWYFEHFGFKNAVIVYETGDYGRGIYESFMEMAAKASRMDSLFTFSLTLDSRQDQSNAVAGNLVEQIQPLPSRLVVLLCHSAGLDAMYPALQAGGIWVPKYQILSTEKHIFSYWAVTPSNIFGLVNHNKTIHYTWALADYGKELPMFFMMSLKMTKEAILNGTERYMIDKWNPDLKTTLNDLQDMQKVFGAPEWRASISASNAYIWYARAFNALMNAGVPVEEMRGDTLKKALMNVTFCGMAICPFNLKANQDADFGWSVNHMCLNGPDCAGQDLSGLGGPYGVNWQTVLTLKGGKVSETGVKFIWGNGERASKPPPEIVACQPGQYLSDEGFCKACSQGWSSPTFNSQNCSACAPGRYVLDFGIKCEACAPGKGSSESGATACAMCVPGQFGPGAQPCQTCAEGKYSDMPDSSECTACGVIQNFSSSPAAASSSSDCKCAENSYSVHDSDFPMCAPCTEGLRCPGGSQVPLLEKGFYVAPGSPRDVQKIEVWKCMSQVACPGQLIEADPPCKEHMTGINCGSCEDGYSRKGDVCEPCGSASWAIVIFSGLGVWLLGGVFEYLWNNRAGHVEAFESVLGSVTLGMVVSFLQTLGVFNRLQLDWPQEFKDVLEFCSFFLFDVQLLRPACVVPQSLTSSYITKLCLPLLIIGILTSWMPTSWFLHKVTKGRYRKLTWSGTLNTIGMVCLGFYISLVSSTVSLLECYSNPNGAKTLRGYPYAVCGDEEQERLMPAFAFALIFYVVGALVLFIYLLVIAPNRVSSADFRHGIRFLVFKFHAKTYWFALSLVLRSLCLALIPVVATDDSYVQFLMTCAVVVFALVAHMAYMPYSDKYGNYLEASELCLLLLILFFGSWFMEDRDFDGADKTTADLLTVFLLLSLALCIFLLVSVFAFAMFLATFPQRALNMHVKQVKGAVPSFLSACKVILASPESDVYDLLMKSSYRDRDVVFNFSDYVLLELAGLVAKGHSHRRLPSTAHKLAERDDSHLEKTVSDAMQKIRTSVTSSELLDTKDENNKPEDTIPQPQEDDADDYTNI